MCCLLKVRAWLQAQHSQHKLSYNSNIKPLVSSHSDVPEAHILLVERKQMWRLWKTPATLTPALRAKIPTLLVPCHSVPGTQGNHSLSSHSIPGSWPCQTPSILHNGHFSACLPYVNSAFPGTEITEVWWGWEGLAKTPQLTCCCGSHRCGGRRCGRSRRGGSRRHRSPSSQGGSGHSGALPRRACRGSPRCWGHRRCGGPGGARPIPRGGRSKLQGRDTVRDGASVSAQALHHKGAGDACKTASKPRDTSGVSGLFFPSPI